MSKPPKSMFDHYWQNNREMITILNNVFMDGGVAYRERGLFSRWRGWAHLGDWQASMERACAALEALPKPLTESEEQESAHNE